MQLLDGRLASMLPLTDRALQFGDGLFRTIKLQAGGLVFWKRHYRKLCADCTVLGIVPPDESLLLDDCEQIMTVSNLREGIIKIIITRGESKHGYTIPDSIQAHRIVYITPLPIYPETHYRHGVTVRLCQTRATWQPALAGIKHLNRLDNVLARREWQDSAIFEGLLLDREGYVQEGVKSNLFIFQDQQLITPDLISGGVAGIIREVLLSSAPQVGIKTTTSPISLQNLLTAQRVWLTNSLIGIMPVLKLAKKTWSTLALDKILMDYLADKMQAETLYLRHR